MIALGWQRLEAVLMAVTGLTLAVISQPGWAWWVWPLILLAPDLSMLGYLAGPRVGATLYNLFHLYGLGMVVALMGVLGGAPLLIAVGGMWLGHVGIDRALGYGLKSPDGFRITHLGRIGRAERR